MPQSGYSSVVLVCDSAPDSDMDICSDSDDEVSFEPYTFHTSPQDDKIVNQNVSNLCSNKDTIKPKQGLGVVIDNLSDSKVSANLLRSNNANISHRETIQLQSNTVVRQVFMGPQVPSAPPYAGSMREIVHDSEKPTCSSSSSTSDEANRCRYPFIKSGAVASTPLTARLPTFHASELGPWCAVISYDACVRLCLKNWASRSLEAPVFLENECALLRTAFGLEQVLLEPEEELLSKRSSKLVSEGVPVKPKKTHGKLKVQVRKVKMVSDTPPDCTCSSIKKQPVVKLQKVHRRLSSMKSTICTEWKATRRVRVTPHFSAKGLLSHQSLNYLQFGTQYLKDMSGLLKVGATSLRNSTSYEAVQETYSCSLRLKSSSEDDAKRMQPGSSETHIFLPDGMGDDLVIKVTDSRGKYCGHVIAQVADIADDVGTKLRWWPIYHEPEHELVGKIQLHVQYSTSTDENSNLKCGIVAETIAYDLVLEAAMKAQNFQQRNLLLHGSWRWLVTEFATYYGVSDAYTKLRYLSYVMDVATPTADCLNVVHDLLWPVITKGKMKGTLSCQENRMLVKLSDQIEEIIALVFENYKSLDELSPSGITDTLSPVSGFVAPALKPALKLYTLLHDILSPEAQLKLCKYFQIAVRKRSGRHLAETNEFVSNSSEKTAIDPLTFCTAYEKMKSLCLRIRNEIFTDIEINNQHVLPSFVDLPNLSSSLYSSELCNRLRAFLVACPPTTLSSPVADLLITTCDFQRDLDCWNISPVKGGVDAKELFHSYVTRRVQDKRLELLESCKLDKLKSQGTGPHYPISAFVDDMYEQLKETLAEFEVIVCRWPEYTLVLEKAIADAERAIVETLEKQYSDVLSSLKENTIPVKAVQYVQKFAKGNLLPFIFPQELGTLFNSMKRMLDVLQPKIESQFKSWSLYISDSDNAVPGELLSEVTVMLRTKFRNYHQAAVEKLATNTRLQNTTNLKKIIQEAKESVVESDIRSRMQPLKDLLTKIIGDLHGFLDIHVFIIFCRGFWDRMGQDVLKLLENRKENRSCYKASRVALSVLDETFSSQMQGLLGHTLQDKDLQPPRSIIEVRSMLCKDSAFQKDNNLYF